MKTYPSISIAIPTFNEEVNIQRCLNSVFNQKYPGKLEVFIVDGGSTDKTVKLAKQYPVIVLSNPEKQAERGKKIALDKATGDYFMILDCDMDLVGTRWFEKMVDPMEIDFSIVGSWTKFVSLERDVPLNRFITLDPIQRDPLFQFLTPSIEDCIIKKNYRFWTVKYKRNHMLPAGFNLYRRNQILETAIKNNKKFMELDNIVILLNKGLNTYAYVQGIGIHHPFLTTLSNLMRKRKRNLETMYFNQPNRRYWTWIDWNNLFHIAKLGIWILYCYLLLPSIVIGIIKSLRYRTWVGLYELPFNICSTNAIIYSFVNQSIKKIKK